MIKELWNVGLKVIDLDREWPSFERSVRRLSCANGLDGGRGTRIRNPHARRRPHAPLRDGRVRESCSRWRSARPHHAVYEVEDLDAEYARISALGAEVLVEPSQVSAAFGRRRLAFFRSPGGFVFEVMQVLNEDLTPVGTRKLAIAAVQATLKLGGWPSAPLKYSETVIWITAGP